MGRVVGHPSRRAAQASVHDREDVETGWYTARNLYRAVAGSLTSGTISASRAAKPSMADKMMQSAGRSIASSVGRQIGNSLLRGILGGLVRR